MSTVRFRTRNLHFVHEVYDAGQRAIFAFWHGRMLIPALFYKHRPVTVLISQHADGEYIAHVMHRLGFGTVRGSTTRGGAAAIRAMRQIARAGDRDIAITPDGPKGPRYEFQAGAVYAARVTGMPIVPAGCAFSRDWELKSWDGFRIPRPFSQARIVVGAPVRIPPGTDADAIEAYRRQLGETLRELTEEAQAWDA
jgi:lysophospholipid acyltransferase (LPLAT)-like uncharacterized protein